MNYQNLKEEYYHCIMSSAFCSKNTKFAVVLKQEAFYLIHMILLLVNPCYEFL